MCEPMTIASLAVTAVSTAVGMYAQNQQGKQQQAAANAQAEYNMQVAENDKAMQRQLAQNELAKGEADRERLQRQAARQQGEMTSMLAASGFQLDSGSNLSMLGESAEEAQYDANIVSQNAARAAWQHEAGMTAADNQMSMISAQQANSKPSGAASMLNMGGTLLSGIGTGLNMYNGYKQTRPGAQTVSYPGSTAGMAFGSNPNLYKGKH